LKKNNNYYVARASDFLETGNQIKTSNLVETLHKFEITGNEM